MASRVRSGLEILLDRRLDLLTGRRAGILANQTAVSPELEHLADLLHARGVDLRCLFGPEHGLRGEAQDMIGVEGSQDHRLGLPVYSLYGSSAASLRPTPEMLADLDLLVIDLQDIGSRYYTFVWTMAIALQACAAAGVRVVVLDRPNPIDGVTVEGPGIIRGWESFVGLHPVPVRHGLTLGEMARLVASELELAVDLEVIAMTGWRREDCFDGTGLPWILPSPNMATLDTALVYPGSCLLEGTNLSEGRGTTRPFELVGAPWIDGWALSEALARQELPGVCFRPCRFRPAFHKHAGQSCGGIQIHVTDRRRFRPFRSGVALLLEVHRLWPDELCWRQQPYEFVSDRLAIDLLAGGDWLRRAVEEQTPLAQLVGEWCEEERLFLERRRPHLLY